MQFFKSCSKCAHAGAPSALLAQQLRRLVITTTHGPPRSPIIDDLTLSFLRFGSLTGRLLIVI